MDKIDNSSLDITKLNIEKIKELFPNVVTEGKIDFEVLRNVLGDEVDDSKEKYQFTWKGKSASIKLAQSPSTATLRPSKEDSKDWDTTENLYIEGDNLEVLKQLQKTYYGKIKMIYIDPPYNTGNDFVYKDDFRDSIKNYKEQTNQTITSNPETNGRYHTDWLNMMYPRLMIAKNLLKTSGVIYISIDDSEYDNLKKICDEIFGSSNFIANVVWKRKRGRDNSAKWFSKSHEYLLIYAKSKNDFDINLLDIDDETKKAYTNPDSDPRGVYRMLGCWARGTQGGVKYDFTTKNGQYFSERLWLMSKMNLINLDDENKLVIRGDNIYRKLFLFENKGRIPETLWDNVSNAANASDEIKNTFSAQIFDTPKPTPYLKEMIKIATKKDDIVLDFFSGSCTISKAVFETNYERNSKIKFIAVQLPEKCDEKSVAFKGGYKNICEIGKERIRRSGEKIEEEWLKVNSNDNLFSENVKKFPIDTGFKVFKLDTTNIQPWDNEMKMDEKTIFDHFIEVFKEGRSKEDILYEVLLKYGVFDMHVSEVVINGKAMYQVGKRYMLICLEDEVTNDDIKLIIEQSPKIVIFKESGFQNDNDKINAIYNLEKAGVEDIKCI